jgi:hypothetical protein
MQKERPDLGTSESYEPEEVNPKLHAARVFATRLHPHVLILVEALCSSKKKKLLLGIDGK